MSRTADPVAKLARVDADIASLRAKLDAKLDERAALLQGLLAQGAAVKRDVAAQVQALTHAQSFVSTGRMLTDAQVREIRRLHGQGMSQAGLGRRYGLSQPSIYKIVRRQTYSDVA